MTGHLDTAEDRDYHRHEAWCMDANERARVCQECNGRGCPCCWDTDSDDEQEIDE